MSRPPDARRARALRWGTLAAFVLLWEVVTQVWAQDSPFFAPPSEVAVEGVPFLLSDSMLSELGTTSVRFAAAFAITAVAGIGIGLALGRLGRLIPVARELLYVLYTVPQVPFYPLFILWLGLGFKSEVAFGVSHGLIPVVFGTMAATARVDPVLLDAGRAMGASRIALTRKVSLPSIVPEVVAALRVGVSLCLVGVLIAELLVSVDGVGGSISELTGTLQPAKLDATLLAVCLAAVGLNSVVRAVERRLSRWRD